jgi:hypothetical protein
LVDLLEHKHGEGKAEREERGVGGEVVERREREQGRSKGRGVCDQRARGVMVQGR